MAAQTIEQRKQQYSRQLAAHTFRQWNAVRQNQSHEVSADKPKEIDVQHHCIDNPAGGETLVYTPGQQDKNKRQREGGAGTYQLVLVLMHHTFQGINVIDYACDTFKERSKGIGR